MFSMLALNCLQFPESHCAKHQSLPEACIYMNCLNNLGIGKKGIHCFT